ncbi:MAG: sodium:calcium antiporter, partial [Gemmatimonadota bacterium]
MDATAAVLFLVGLGALIAGAEALVRGASRLAAAAGIPPVVIGLTVVAFGTSAPELAVSVRAAFEGQADVALGNVVGSNICNVLLILGAAAAVAPLAVAVKIVRFDVWVMIGVSALMLLLGLDGR